MTQPYFILSRTRGAASAMVLDFEGYPTMRKAQSAKHWQDKLELPDYENVICTRASADTFAPIDGGDIIKGHQSPYTLEAWQGFLDGWRA